MMSWNGHGAMNGWEWLPMTLGMIVLVGLLIAAGIVLLRHLAHSNQAQPAPALLPVFALKILAERFARGEIDAEEYTAGLAALREAGIA